MRYICVEIFAIVVLMIFFSCEKAIDWQFQMNADTTKIVVDGIITSENKHQTIKLSLPVACYNCPPRMISGASVVVSDGTKDHVFTEDSLNKGVYVSNEQFYGVPGNTYYLTVIYKGKTYSAQAEMISVTDFEKVSYVLDTTKNLYKLTNLPNVFSLNENAMYEITIDMSELPEYADSSYEQSHIVLYYYRLTSIDISEIAHPDKEKIYFPYGSKITEKKYSLTPEHAEFLRSLLLETEWRGGLYDIEQGNVETNITDGYGYFGACAVITKYIYVQ